MGAHIIDGEFQSDKYPTTPRGKVPLSVKDQTAQDLLWEYAQRRRAVDAEFADDLEACLRRHGYEPPPQHLVDQVRASLRAANVADRVREVVRSEVLDRTACVAGWEGFSAGSISRMANDIARRVVERLAIFEDGGEPRNRQPLGPHAHVATQKGAATPGQGATAQGAAQAAGNVAEPQLGPTPDRAEHPPLPLDMRTLTLARAAFWSGSIAGYEFGSMTEGNREARFREFLAKWIDFEHRATTTTPPPSVWCHPGYRCADWPVCEHCGPARI